MTLPASAENQHTSFFDKLQNAEGLDLRDNRGKRHQLPFILFGVTLALLTGRDGNLSSIQRFLRNRNEALAEAAGVAQSAPVSRAQLPLILAKVCVKLFDQLLLSSYGVSLSADARQWFGVDGKELKGSIETGCKRGEAVVQAVSHKTREVQSQDYYHGRKASEVVTARELLAAEGLLSQKVSLDALHCNPKSLAPIAEAGGSYLVGVKENQEELLAQVEAASQAQKPLYESQECEKSHGRLTARHYQVYDLTGLSFAARWSECGLSRLVKVLRESAEMKTGKKSVETSYYVSNESGCSAELCQAVRGHWSVEVNNHQRDVTFAEDGLKAGAQGLNRALAGLRTLGGALLQRLGEGNKKALIDNFKDDFGSLIGCLRTLNFL